MNTSPSNLYAELAMSRVQLDEDDYILIPQNRNIFLCTKQRKYGKIEIEKTLYEQHPEGEFENAEN